MKLKIHPSQVNLWLSSHDTQLWANKPGAAWPCSELRGRSVLAVFDRNGLCDFAIDSGRGSQDCSSEELNAITSDFLTGKLPESHPCYDVAVGQFLTR